MLPRAHALNGPLHACGRNELHATYLVLLCLRCQDAIESEFVVLSLVVHEACCDISGYVELEYVVRGVHSQPARWPCNWLNSDIDVNVTVLPFRHLWLVFGCLATLALAVVAQHTGTQTQGAARNPFPSSIYRCNHAIATMAKALAKAPRKSQCI